MAQEGEVNTSDWLPRNVVPREDLEESRTGTRQGPWVIREDSVRGQFEGFV